MKYGLPLVLSVAALSMAAYGHTKFRGLNDTEAELFKKLKKATSVANPEPRDVAETFEIDAACAEQTCWFENEKFGSLEVQDGNLRPTPKLPGFFMVLDGIGPDCVRTARVRQNFRVSEPKNGCSHGVCLYLRDDPISFGIDDRKAKCISSVVINTAN